MGGMGQERLGGRERRGDYVSLLGSCTAESAVSSSDWPHKKRLRQDARSTQGQGVVSVATARAKEGVGKTSVVVFALRISGVRFISLGAMYRCINYAGHLDTSVL
jgi:hypothetical protein